MPHIFVASFIFLLSPLLFFSGFAKADASNACHVAPTKYSVCIEDMPASLSQFQSNDCKVKGLAAGRECLDAYDQWFEDALERNDSDSYKKYADAKRLLDSGDSQGCLRYQNCVSKRPSEKFLDRTQAISTFIIKTSNYYGVPPEAVVCAIGGDATTTSKAYPNQSLYEDPMIQSTPVREAQRDLGAKGLRFQYPPKPSEKGITDQEINSIRQTALILRHALTSYQSAGFSGDDLPPEVLASIYHLGVYRGSDRTNWAGKTANEGKKPGMSFIGLFCKRYISIFRLKLGLKDISTGGAAQPQPGNGGAAVR